MSHQKCLPPRGFRASLRSLDAYLGVQGQEGKGQDLSSGKGIHVSTNLVRALMGSSAFVHTVLPNIHGVSHMPDTV